MRCCILRGTCVLQGLMLQTLEPSRKAIGHAMQITSTFKFLLHWNRQSVELLWDQHMWEVVVNLARQQKPVRTASGQDSREGARVFRVYCFHVLLLLIYTERSGIFRVTIKQRLAFWCSWPACSLLICSLIKWHIPLETCFKITHQGYGLLIWQPEASQQGYILNLVWTKLRAYYPFGKIVHF